VGQMLFDDSGKETLKDISRKKKRKKRTFFAKF
jgi:hypothetical protein